MSCARGTSRVFTHTGHIALQHHVVDRPLPAEWLAISCTYTESTRFLVRQVHLLPLCPGTLAGTAARRARGEQAHQGGWLDSRNVCVGSAIPSPTVDVKDAGGGVRQHVHRADAACRVWNRRLGVEPDAAAVAGFALVCINARCPLQHRAAAWRQQYARACWRRWRRRACRYRRAARWCSAAL